MSDQKKLFLLDAYALIYRAHFAFTKNPRINSKGHNTSVPFGFTNTLLEVLTKQKPSHIAIAFDTAKPTFRDEIFKEYKANRQETPEDIRYGIPKVKEIIKGFNIPIIELDGYEADDIIGTIAYSANKKGFQVFMMTPDKDFGQLVTENVLLYKPAYMGNVVDVMGPKEVCDKWDIDNVSQVVDMLGLQGDASDNIPGIPGIGPKTASTLLKKYGNIEGIIAHSHELKGKQKELVETYGDQALLSKKLATIIIDVPVSFDEKLFEYNGPNEEVLKPIFEDLEFRTMGARAFSDSNVATPKRNRPSQLSMFDGGDDDDTVESNTEKTSIKDQQATYQVLENEAEIKKLISKLSSVPSFSVDVTTNALPNFDYDITGIAFSTRDNEAFFIPVGKNNSSILNLFSEVLANSKIEKTGHNLKAVLLVLSIYGIEVKGPLFDTMLCHYLIEPEAAHDLEILCAQYLNYTLLKDGEATAGERLCEQVDQILKLKEKLNAELKEKNADKLFREVEMPLVSVLAAMEAEGVKVDINALKIMSESLRDESEKVQEEIYTLAGTQFNIASPKQLGEILFDQMKLIEKPKKTKTGQYATGEDVLRKLADEHIIVQRILDFREYEKLRSTYVDALPRMISKRDGKIHTDYRQAVAATGRLSSNNPNLQNIPIRTEKGRQIRKAFVASSSDYVFMSADYSQIELRIAASFADDKTMIEAFKNGRDIHTTTAAKVFNVPVEEVTPDMRRKAKEVNFGILYGSTAFGLSQNLNIPRSEASEIINAYFKEFAAIKKYMDDSINMAKEKEYVETILGRRRYLRDINSRNQTTRGFAERNAINAPIQGSAADIIKIAMINIHDWLKKEKLNTKMTMQVHDELVFDVYKEEVDVVRENIIRLMKAAVSLKVPMEVEVGVGQNWLEAH